MMRPRPAVLCTAALALALGGCTQLGLFTLNVAAGLDSFSRKSNVAYGSNTANRLDVYLPAHPRNSPIVVFFYGGGWDSGDKASYKFVGAALANAGIIAVLPNYTLYPAAKFPVFMQDAALAVGWTRAHAAAWGGDPAELYVVGHSSGAQIAVLLALDPEYLVQVGGNTRWIRGAVGLAGPYDFLPFTDAYLNDLFGPPSHFPLSQPINYVRADAPPLLLMCGLRDRRVDPNNTRRLAAAIQKIGGRVRTRCFDSAGHADLVAAFSTLERSRRPVLAEIRGFIAAEHATAPGSPLATETGPAND
jgi:acetyl esterase/lipase